MTHEETVARGMAAKKMGLVKDPQGLRLPDDLWQQMLPAAREYLEDLAFELHGSEVQALSVSNGDRQCP
jgi:hypothetical protein